MPQPLRSSKKRFAVTNRMRNLDGNWSPRLGLLYDWTKQGRSKVYGSWGRFYESVPMDINERAFGGEVSLLQRYDAGTQCGGAIQGYGGVDGNVNGLRPL